MAYSCIFQVVCSGVIYHNHPEQASGFIDSQGFKNVLLQTHPPSVSWETCTARVGPRLSPVLKGNNVNLCKLKGKKTGAKYRKCDVYTETMSATRINFIYLRSDIGKHISCSGKISMVFFSAPIPWMVLGINSVADPRTVPAEGPMTPQQTPGPEERNRRNANFKYFD